MSAHTKGPWTFGHRGQAALWVGPDHEQRVVALVPHDTSEEARAESLDNARLLAASPALLKALDDLLYAAESLTSRHSEDSFGDDVCRAMKNAEAAIAKAGGVQS